MLQSKNCWEILPNYLEFDSLIAQIIFSSEKISLIIPNPSHPAKFRYFFPLRFSPNLFFPPLLF